MKRSIINRTINEAISFFKRQNYPLPPFAYWKSEDWHKEKAFCKELMQTRLGWDVTDFGSGNFREIGRTIFTLRNGKAGSSEYPKSYAQKIMFLQEQQKSPIHYHRTKREDIINVGGGRIAIRFWRVSKTGTQSEEKLIVSLDGRKTELPAGQKILLSPGQSVCVVPETFHEFCAEKGLGPVLSMEVSSVCDDLNDNIWLSPANRFPEIIEDEERSFYLCSEYAALAG